MKKNILNIVVSTVFVFLAATGPLCAAESAAVSDENGEKGKFQLYNAVYNSAIIQRSQTTTFIEKRLFKINKETGETWMLIDAIRDGKDIKYWKKIENEALMATGSMD
ncbi:MAG: hypothetical protein U9O82_05885 [Thermodesulfobacteriota bacterium]|nr:hypothetical protein [Thermodesulfobacteriota bacterium]